MAGSAQEKLRQRSDLEAMVEQIEQESLEEQAHALLHSWQKGRILGSMLEEQGFRDATAEMHRACTAAKDVIDKVLSPALRRTCRDNVARDGSMLPLCSMLKVSSRRRVSELSCASPVSSVSSTTHCSTIVVTSHGHQ